MGAALGQFVTGVMEVLDEQGRFTGTVSELAELCDFKPMDVGRIARTTAFHAAMKLRGFDADVLNDDGTVMIALTPH